LFCIDNKLAAEKFEDTKGVIKQKKQNRTKHHTFTSLHMGFVILYLNFLTNTVFSPKKPVTICSMLEGAYIA
jgi:hypothetical protein